MESRRNFRNIVSLWMNAYEWICQLTLILIRWLNFFFFHFELTKLFNRVLLNLLHNWVCINSFCVFSYRVSRRSPVKKLGYNSHQKNKKKIFFLKLHFQFLFKRNNTVWLFWSISVNKPQIIKFRLNFSKNIIVFETQDNLELNFADWKISIHDNIGKIKSRNETKQVKFSESTFSHIKKNAI